MRILYKNFKIRYAPDSNTSFEDWIDLDPITGCYVSPIFESKDAAAQYIADQGEPSWFYMVTYGEGFQQAATINRQIPWKHKQFHGDLNV
jgi:hypothetical protein